MPSRARRTFSLGEKESWRAGVPSGSFVTGWWDADAAPHAVAGSVDDVPQSLMVRTAEPIHRTSAVRSVPSAHADAAPPKPVALGVTRETELEEKKRNRECNPGCGVLFPTTKKNSGRSPDWDGHAVTVCECGRNTKYQVACWDNGSVRDLRLRRWKP